MTDLHYDKEHIFLLKSLHQHPHKRQFSWMWTMNSLKNKEYA